MVVYQKLPLNKNNIFAVTFIELLPNKNNIVYIIDIYTSLGFSNRYRANIRNLF